MIVLEPPFAHEDIACKVKPSGRIYSQYCIEHECTSFESAINSPDVRVVPATCDFRLQPSYRVAFEREPYVLGESERIVGRRIDIVFRTCACQSA